MRNKRLEELKKEYGVMSSYCWDFEEGMEGVKVIDYEKDQDSYWWIIHVQGCQTGKRYKLWADIDDWDIHVETCEEVEGE
ncbi:hypothetical protein [Persephonella sp.]